MSSRSLIEGPEIDKDINQALIWNRTSPLIKVTNYLAMGATLMIPQRRIRVLIVEDNKADARLVQDLLNQTGLLTQVTLVGDGKKQSI